MGANVPATDGDREDVWLWLCYHLLSFANNATRVSTAFSLPRLVSAVLQAVDVLQICAHCALHTHVQHALRVALRPQKYQKYQSMTHGDRVQNRK